MQKDEKNQLVPTCLFALTEVNAKPWMDFQWHNNQRGTFWVFEWDFYRVLVSIGRSVCSNANNAPV